MQVKFTREETSPNYDEWSIRVAGERKATLSRQRVQAAPWQSPLQKLFTYAYGLFIDDCEYIVIKATNANEAKAKVKAILG